MGWGNNGGWHSGGPWGSGSPTPPEKPANDLDDFLKKGQDRFRQWAGGGGSGGSGGAGSSPFGSGKMLLALAAGLFGLWFLSNTFYRVEPDEAGVVLRFGKFERITEPGLRLRFPPPIETVMTPKVTRVNRVEIGFRSGVSGTSRAATDRAVPEESLMLTGDENIVDIDFEVQWKIKDAKLYLFSIYQPEDAVKNAAESVMREVIGRTPISSALAEGRSTIEQTAKELLQSVLDSYDSGIDIVRLQMLKVDPPAAVIDAFRDVQTARADRERARNEAETYRNDIIPRARGEAERMNQDALAYKQQVVSRAEGEASRFGAVYKEYQVAKDITKKRMYLETMEDILSGMNKVIVDSNANKSGVLPYLPLESLKTAPKSTKEGE
ncbi:MAG: FtsH protease activity modulator HflK [Alphaproteobacteria bacterium]|nr:FtsH protease activity modulator HflK [Alphaproteobacteria bacterium]